MADFKPGDLVKPSAMALQQFKFKVKNWPWKVLGVRGDIVIVLRKSHVSNREYRDSFHKDFLEKVEEAVSG